MSLLFTPQVGEHVAMCLVQAFEAGKTNELYLCTSIEKLEGFDPETLSWQVQVKEEVVGVQHIFHEKEVRFRAFSVRIKERIVRNGPWKLFEPAKEAAKP